MGEVKSQGHDIVTEFLWDTDNQGLLGINAYVELDEPTIAAIGDETKIFLGRLARVAATETHHAGTLFSMIDITDGGPKLDRDAHARLAAEMVAEYAMKARGDIGLE